VKPGVTDYGSKNETGKSYPEEILLRQTEPGNGVQKRQGETAPGSGKMQSSDRTTEFGFILFFVCQESIQMAVLTGKSCFFEGFVPIG